MLKFKFIAYNLFVLVAIHLFAAEESSYIIHASDAELSKIISVQKNNVEKIKVDAYFLFPDFSSTNVTKLEHKFESVSEIIKFTDLALPKNLMLQVVKGSPNSSSYNDYENLLMLFNETSVLGERSAVIAIHEYGHAIFEASMAKTNSFGPAVSAKRRYFDLNRMRKFGGEISFGRISNNIFINGYVAEQEKWQRWLLSEESEKSFFEKRQLQETWSDQRFWRKKENADWYLEQAYEELFADVIAVFANDNDPQAVFKSLCDSCEGEQRERFLARDFSYAQNRFDVWKYNEAFGPHGVFSPVRYYIYETFLADEKDKSPSAQAAFLQELFDAIMSEYAAFGDEPSDTTNYVNWNVRLMKMLPH